jgi:CRP/FNR family cyclic AMP-dependent transcriptional regulator
MIDYTILDNIAIFDSCTEEEKKKLAKLMNEERIKRKRHVYVQGDPAQFVYFLLSGSVTMIKYIEYNDKDFYVGTIREGEIFGFGEVFGGTFDLTMVCEEDSVLLVMGKETFFEDFLAIKSLNLYILRTLAYLARIHNYMLEWDAAESRLEYFLFYVAHTYGEKSDDSIRITRAYTHDQIAEMLRCTREYISKKIGKMKKDGILLESVPNLIIDAGWFEEKCNDDRFDLAIHRYFHID